MNTEQTNRFKVLLHERLAGLTRVESDKRNQAQPVELDQTRVGRLSRQDALQSQALSVAALERNRVEIDRLRTAIGRIDAGEYGFCAECGEDIPAARLEVDPAADYCVSCAQLREKR